MLEDKLPDLRGKVVAIYFMNKPDMRDGTIVEDVRFERQGGRLFLVGRTLRRQPRRLECRLDDMHRLGLRRGVHAVRVRLGLSGASRLGSTASDRPLEARVQTMCGIGRHGQTLVDVPAQLLDHWRSERREASVGLRCRVSAPSAGLVVTGFGAARLSDFDLDMPSPLETTRYAALEAIAGGVAAGSDGTCFEGTNE